MDAPVSPVVPLTTEVFMASGSVSPLNDWHRCRPLRKTSSVQTGTGFDRKLSPVVSEPAIAAGDNCNRAGSLDDAVVTNAEVWMFENVASWRWMAITHSAHRL